MTPRHPSFVRLISSLSFVVAPWLEELTEMLFSELDYSFSGCVLYDFRPESKQSHHLFPEFLHLRMLACIPLMPFQKSVWNDAKMRSF